MPTDMMLDKDVVHEYYHELEAVFYILCWICTRQGGPYGIRRDDDSTFDRRDSILTDWVPRSNGKEDLRTAGCLKSAFVSMPGLFESDILDKIHSYFYPLKDCLWGLRDLLNPPSHIGAEKVERIREAWRRGPENQLRPNGEHVDFDERCRIPAKYRDMDGLFDDFEEVLSKTLDGLSKTPDPPPSVDNKSTPVSNDDGAPVPEPNVVKPKMALRSGCKINGRCCLKRSHEEMTDDSSPNLVDGSLAVHREQAGLSSPGQREASRGRRNKRQRTRY